MDNKLEVEKLIYTNNSICNFNKIKIPKMYKVKDVHLKLLLKALYESINIKIQEDSNYFDLLKDVLVEV